MDTVSRQKGAGAATWKVGELARRTGLSVRTLRYYDEIGLLSPARRTEAGHRLYAAGDVARLQQIKSLRALGFGLEEIRACLQGPGFSALRVVELHISRIEEQIVLQQRLRERLEALAARLRSAEEISAEGFMEAATEVIEMSERTVKYYTQEQLQQLEERRRVFGEERIRAAEKEWAELIEQVRAEMERGTDPADRRVQLLAGRWMDLVNQFTGGDPGIERSLGNMWRQEESIHGMETGPMREMMGYVSRALVASKGDTQ